MAAIDLFAVQPYVSADTYRSAHRFHGAMRALAMRCQSKRERSDGGAPAAPALIVYPENVGTFLALAPLGRLARHLPSTETATALALLARPVRFGRAVRRVGLSHAQVAALLALAPEVRAIYERTFSDIARETGTTVVAGSALLPDDDADDRVYNVSHTFGPDGRRLAVTRKVNLVPDLEDTLGLTTGQPDALAPVQTPVGPLGTLICYDGFAVPHTQREPRWCAVGGKLAASRARIVAQPSANPWSWDGPWVHRPAGSTLVRRVQWHSEGLAAQLPSMEGVRYAVTAHLIGHVLDLRFEGRSEILERLPDGSVCTLAEARSAVLAPASEEVVHARVDAPWLDGCGAAGGSEQ